MWNGAPIDHRPRLRRVGAPAIPGSPPAAVRRATNAVAELLLEDVRPAAEAAVVVVEVIRKGEAQAPADGVRSHPRQGDALLANEGPCGGPRLVPTPSKVHSWLQFGLQFGLCQ